MCGRFLGGRGATSRILASGRKRKRAVVTLGPSSKSASSTRRSKSDMEYLPSSADLQTPKGVIIVNTLAAVILTALGLRLWMRSAMKKSPPRVGRFEMHAKDFGDAAETRRDVARTFAAGCICVQVDGEPTPALMRPPSGLKPGVDAASVDAHIATFKEALGLRVPSVDLSAGATFERLLRMLTVNPAMSALTTAGEVPMLKHNRFLIRVVTGASDADAPPSLHCLTIGYVGAPPNKPKSDEVLTVASPNLLVAPAAGADGASALDYALTYALRKATHTKLDDEMALAGVTDVPVAAE